MVSELVPYSPAAAAAAAADLRDLADRLERSLEERGHLVVRARSTWRGGHRETYDHVSRALEEQAVDLLRRLRAAAREAEDTAAAVRRAEARAASERDRERSAAPGGSPRAHEKRAPTPPPGRQGHRYG